MLTRRTLLAAAALAPSGALSGAPSGAMAAQPPPPPPPATAAEAASFARYVAGVKAEARRSGLRPAMLERAFAGVRVNTRVIELDRRQPEFTLTWEQYRSRIVSATRIKTGRDMYARHRALLDAVSARYHVAPGVIMGIWGLESNYGVSSGGFHVVEALATLAWEGRRAKFFRSELMDALKILDSGDIAPAQMVGSYAGAMGQPQFMPDSFLKFAVDWNGDGKRDLWGNLGDVFASVANYLARSGWAGQLPWGEPVRLPPGFNPALAGREHQRTLSEWAPLGVRAGARVAPSTKAAVLLPGGAGGEAFLAYHPNFLAIRRYNPSDFYCISVGLIGDAVTI
ncbi:MAG: lytic murein transglycosylase [Rhodospirillales bacterium]|nr:lytic murein transglycosylase [Rhodospirillales bacterium]